MVTFDTEPFDLSLQSAQYKVFVNGSPVSALPARVSAVPFNQVWPGYQRPINQTELASFSAFDMEAPARITAECARPFKDVKIRPSSYGILPETDGTKISFTLNEPKPLTVECDGWHGALHLFPNAPDKYGIKAKTEKIRYFGPGVHHPGKMALNSGETLYVADGAIVYGCVEAKHQREIKIIGRGVLDGSKIPRKGAPGLISLYNCEDVFIEGVIMRDPSSWTLITAKCKNVAIENVKLIGLWRYNADGIDVVNSSGVTISRSFLRTFDDSIVMKGLKSWGGDATDPGFMKNILSEKCVIWCDWGRALEIGAETCADYFDDIVFKDCDIIHNSHVALDIQHGDRAKITNVLFEDIRVEMDDFNPMYSFQKEPGEFYTDAGRDFCPRLFYIGIAGTMWSKDTVLGSVDGVTVKDVKVTSKLKTESVISGADENHTVENVAFKNLTINGKKITSADEMDLKIKSHVKNVTFR